MGKETQVERAERFDRLHRTGKLLVLPNAWDAAAAKVFVAEGFPAIATTSAGVAMSLGYWDGEKAPFDEIVAATQRIARAVSVPVSADIESGFGATPKDVAYSVARIIEAGAVGVNIEDSRKGERAGLYAPAEQAERLSAAREAAEKVGVNLYINARTDVLARAEQEDASLIHDAITRAERYMEAGASGVFVVGELSKSVIRQLAEAIDAPLNVLAGQVTLPFAELEELGVARVTFGSGPMRAAMGLAVKMAREWKEAGTFATMSDIGMPFADAGKLFAD